LTVAEGTGYRPGVTDITTRKDEHLELCATGDVAHRRSTLLDEVDLVHDALPDMALDEVDLGCDLLGKRLAAPVVIAAMTGGTERAGRLNRDLAAVAEELGVGFGLGSQRPMLRDEAVTWTYAVRKRAPTTLVIGNLGLWQARQMGPRAVEELARSVGADAIAVHLNPAQELVQPNGDRDFRGGTEALAALALALEMPLLVKETGCGLGPHALRALRNAGVRRLDVAGAGGTSWVAVEALRTTESPAREVGEALRDWGVPTAAAVGLAAKVGFDTLIASGGIGDGLDAARAIALGAHAVGIARPILVAHRRDGVDGVRRFLAGVVETLRAVMLLTGCRRLDDLRRAPRVVGPRLERWLAADA
jgi:isopentenyl-diphosphate delta-isomerase